MEEKITFIKVFVPYAQYHHLAYYAYDENEYGRLKFGTAVMTSLGVGVIVNEDVSEEKIRNMNIVDIFRLANPKEEKTIRKDWWDVFLEIHLTLKEKNL